MRLLPIALIIAALLCGSAAAKSRSPCDMATKFELARVLGGRAIAPDPSTIGEETAPFCIWTTASGARVKIEVWHGDELSVVAERTALDYFVSRRKEALKFKGALLVGIGEAAFRTAFGRDQSGEIGVLKDHHFFVFVFEHIPYARALKFTKAIVRRC